MYAYWFAFLRQTDSALYRHSLYLLQFLLTLFPKLKHFSCILSSNNQF